MSTKTSIEWTATVHPDGTVTPGKTWNPVTGCDKVSPGCAHCYAEGVAERFWAKQYPSVLNAVGDPRPRQFFDVQTHVDRLLEPLSWRKPSKVFVNSMSDLFHEDVSDVFIERVFSVMALAERHTFQVLTKRPGRMLAWFRARRFDVKGYAILQTETAGECRYAHPWPLPNVWLGVSVENQHFADERIPLLLQTPAAVRFISAEPLLGPVDLEAVPLPTPGASWYGLRGVAQPATEKNTEPDDWKYWTRRESKLDWVIVGGESGPGARPFDLAWARSIVQQCQAAKVPVFVKQLGAMPLAGRMPHPDDMFIRLRDRKGGDPSEWPSDLQVRQFPEGRA